MPREGERFEVSKERLEVLLGKNGFNKPFVKVVEKEVKEATLPKEKEVKAILPKKKKK